MIAPGEREFELETGCWSAEVRFAALAIILNTAESSLSAGFYYRQVDCCLPIPSHEHTVPPSIGSPASVRAKYDGHEGGNPIFIIEELTYLPKLLRSSPRKSMSTSPSSTPTTPSRLFGKGKKRTAAATQMPTETALTHRAHLPNVPASRMGLPLCLPAPPMPQESPPESRLLHRLRPPKRVSKRRAT